MPRGPVKKLRVLPPVTGPDGDKVDDKEGNTKKGDADRTNKNKAKNLENLLIMEIGGGAHIYRIYRFTHSMT